MKNNTIAQRVLKKMEIEDNKAWLAAHLDAFRFMNMLLMEKESKVSKEIYREIDYDSPNWQLLKADQSGQLRLIKELQSILKED